MATGDLTMEQMTVVLDNIPTAVLVSTVDDRRLLYTNSMAREMFTQADGAGAACYMAAGLGKTCPSYRTGKMSRPESLVREYRNPINQRVYQLSGKLIDWAGEEAYIEYILDITGWKAEEEQLKETGQNLAVAFDGLSCGLCVYQMKEKDIIPLFHNRVFYDIMGYSEENVR
ncbi:MAG: PAS domain-containing protein, partial [Clostridiales bacterium]|nr:PAS domain-containing protein [Clostridiales bacterium]